MKKTSPLAALCAALALTACAQVEPSDRPEESGGNEDRLPDSGVVLQPEGSTPLTDLAEGTVEIADVRGLLVASADVYVPVLAEAGSQRFTIEAAAAYNLLDSFQLALMVRPRSGGVWNELERPWVDVDGEVLEFFNRFDEVRYDADADRFFITAGDYQGELLNGEIRAEGAGFGAEPMQLGLFPLPANARLQTIEGTYSFALEVR